jgi:hypothetical protein
MTEPLLQNVDRTTAFEPIDRGSMTQMVEGEGAKVLILFLGLLCDGCNDTPEVTRHLFVTLRRTLAAAPKPGLMAVPEQRLGLKRDAKGSEYLKTEVVPLIDKIKYAELAALSDHGQLLPVPVEVRPVALRQFVQPCPGPERCTDHCAERSGRAVDHHLDVSMLGQHDRIASFLKPRLPPAARFHPRNYRV